MREPSQEAQDWQPQGSDDEMLRKLQRETFDYFLHQVDPVTGLTLDTNRPGGPASTAVVGMAMSALLVGVEENFLSREHARERVLRVLRFLAASPQGPEPNAAGYRGFYYHFLDPHSGRRAWDSELSTIDTAFLIAGALSVALYFKGHDADEREIRRLADLLYRRIDWAWALDGGATLTHGWTPERGFLPYRWDQGYSEAMLMYLLALGSPTHPVPAAGYAAWIATFPWQTDYGIARIHAAPLFIHQFSHLWVDFRGLFDDCNRKRGLDYFENSRRATLAQQKYAIANPHAFAHYGAFCWGFTASDGPGPVAMELDGKRRDFFGYEARGAPSGPDDGTVSPWAVVASLPFAPEIVVGTIRHAIERLKLKNRRLYGFDASFNPTFPDRSANEHGWVSPWRFGLNQGPIVLMIANHRRSLLWQLMKECAPIRDGLQRAGFRGGWLDEDQEGADFTSRNGPSSP